MLHVLDAVVELPAHLLREGGGEGLEALVHHPRHHRAPGGHGCHVAFALRGEGAARVDGGGGGGRSIGREEEEEQKKPRHGDGARGSEQEGEAMGGRRGEDSCRTPPSSLASSPRLLAQFCSRCWWRGELCAEGCGGREVVQQLVLKSLLLAAVLV